MFCADQEPAQVWVAGLRDGALSLLGDTGSIRYSADARSDGLLRCV